MIERNFRNLGWASALLVAGVACDAAPGPGTAPQDDQRTTDPTARVTAPFNVNDVVQQIRLSYRPDGLRIVGGQPTYAVEASDGIVRIRPRHYESDKDTLNRGLNAEYEVLEGTAVAFETTMISRDQPYDLGSGDMFVVDDGSLRIDRQIAEERFVNDTVGVEQMWVFDEAPAGEGDLSVRVTIGGQSYVGATDVGHHFVDEVTGVGILYGVATWVDSTGLRTPVTVQFEDGDLVLTVPDDVVATSVYPATLDPVVSAEFGLTNPGTGPSKYVEQTPAIGWDGTNYFVVWSDQRNGSSFDIYGARVSPERVLVDNPGIPISTAEFDQLNPAVSFNNTNFLVTWSDFRNGADFDVYGARVSTAGVVQDTNGIPIVTAAGDQINPDNAANGATYAVAWQDARSGTANVYAARVDGNGAVLNANGIAMDAGTDAQTNPAIECDGVFCFVVWVEGPQPVEDVHGVRFRTSNGFPADAESIEVSSSTITSTQRDLLPDLAFDGTNYLVVWQSNRESTYDIWGNRVVAATGVVLDAGGFRINNRASGQRAPAVAFSGGQYMVIWLDESISADGNVLGARVQTDGTVTDATGFGVNTSAGTTTFPAIGAGSNFFVAWADGRTGLVDLYGTSIQANAQVDDFTGVVLARSANRQISASLAWDGFNFFVVFTDSRTSGGDNYDVIGARVTRTGVVLDPSGRAISLAAGNQLAPDIAYNATAQQFLVTWSDRRSGNFDVRASRIDNAYTVLDDFVVSGGAANEAFSTVSYSAGADRYLVAWRDGRNGNNDIFAARVASTGAIDDAAGIGVGVAAGTQTRPDVASDGAGWLVAWSDERNGGGTDDIRGAIVGGAGTITTADFQISGAANVQEFVRLAHDGTNYVAVWDDRRNGADSHDIFAARISNAGVVQDANGIGLATSATLDEERPAITIVDDTTTGANTWFVAWRQQIAQNGEARNLIGQQFTIAGAAVDTVFTLSDAAGDEDQPAVAASINDSEMVIYQRFDSTLTLLSERVFGRAVTFP